MPVVKIPDDLSRGATRAASQVSGGTKSSAYLNYLRTEIGENYLRRLTRDGVTVWQAQCAGLLPIVGSGFSVPAAVGQTSIANAAIATGTWAHYVVNASDPAKYIATDVTPIGGAGPATLSGDLSAGGTVVLSEFTINSPTFDVVTLTGLAASVGAATATVSVDVGGAIPAGALMLLQISSDQSNGPWLASPTPAATVGSFTWTVSGLAPATTYYYRAFVYAGALIYAQTANATFFVPASGGTDLASAYATCMTSLNDFAPGNSAGIVDWAGSAWDRSDHFQTSPYGSNIDPVRFGQSEPGVGVTDANYIVTRRAASSRNANAFVLWPWFMPPKNALQAAGNWRVQIRDLQAAVKVDSLTNPWTLVYGPAQVPSYGLNNLGGLRVSGNLADYTGTTGVPTFAMDANDIEARTEASGGISFKSVGKSLSQCLVEFNAPDPGQALPASATPARTVAFAAAFWTRLITDTGAGSVPSELQIGVKLGVDFYDASGRVGTPGQSRLVQITPTWKPVVVAFVLTGLPPAVPQTPAVTATWLAANPPPFV